MSNGFDMMMVRPAGLDGPSSRGIVSGYQSGPAPGNHGTPCYSHYQLLVDLTQRERTYSVRLGEGRR